jgi:Lrp/AsnC family leucine-responsive transcriptional regulator
MLPGANCSFATTFRISSGQTVDEPEMLQLASRQLTEEGRVDALDRRILIELQQDGSLTNARLAQALGLSQSAMSERVRRLEQDGHITGYRALVDPASLGLGLQAFVAAVLNHHSTESITSFESGVVKLVDVRACYHVAGRFDYLLHVAVRDLEHLGQLIKYDIAAIPGVDKVETMLVYSEVKPDAGWPCRPADEEQ